MIEAGQQRRMALLELERAVSTLYLALTPEMDVPLSEIKKAGQNICAAYFGLQSLEIAGISAMLQDLEVAKKQAESPIMQPGMMPRGRG